MLSFVPFLIGIAIQFVTVFYIMFISIIFMFLIAPIISGKSYGFNDLQLLWANMDFNVVASIIFSVSCILFFAIWYYKSCGGNFRLNPKKNFHLLEFPGIILLVPGTQFLSTIIVAFVSVIFPSWLEAYEELLETAGLSEDISILMMIYSVVLAPISEELIFRGVTLRIAQRAFPFWLANIIQAILFGVFHMNLLQGVYTFVVGLILGYICHRSGTIYHAILFHFLFNLWGTTAASWLVMDDPIIQVGITILGAIIGLVVGFTLLNLGSRKKEAIA